MPHILTRHEESGATAEISTVTMVELEGGVARASTGREQRRKALDAMYENLGVLPFTQREALAYGEIVRRLGFAWPKVIDRMIAACALVNGVRLATLNERDFRDIPGLQLEDWSV